MTKFLIPTLCMILFVNINNICEILLGTYGLNNRHTFIHNKLKNFKFILNNKLFQFSYNFLFFIFCSIITFLKIINVLKYLINKIIHFLFQEIGTIYNVNNWKLCSPIDTYTNNTYRYGMLLFHS